MLACSSAGGGLRIAVVGNEELVTAEAGRRVALSSGGRVVHVAQRRADPRRPARAAGQPSPTSCCSSAAPTAATPRCCWPARRALADGPVARARSWSPATSRPATRSPRCWRAGTPYVAGRQRGARRSACSPRTRPGPRSARCSCAHVIGGKHLSQRADFTAMVRGATPDVVLTAVELLAAASTTSTGRRGRGGRRRRRRHHRRALASSSSTPRTPGLAARWSRPSRSAAPSRATSACAGARCPPSRRGSRPAWSTTPTGLRAAAAAAARRPGVPARHGDAERADDEADRDGRGRGRAAPARRAAPGAFYGPTAGWSSAAARTSARSTCWSGPAGCCATTRTEVADAGAGPVDRGRRTGRLAAAARAADAWSTATTCWPRPGCSRAEHPAAAHALLARLRAEPHRAG